MALKLLIIFFHFKEKKESEGGGLWNMLVLRNGNFADSYQLPVFLLPNDNME